MLKELRLTHFVLVERAAIEFAPGFNVLSGESGSGKSAIMNGLNLIAGGRSDPALIRRGADKAIVEAVFEIDTIPNIPSLLEEAGIDHTAGEELFIRRELSTTGKGRAFINNQLAQLTLLKQVSEHLFDLVGQHANQKLLSLDYHRNALDLFGNLQDKVSSFTRSWEEENRLRRQLAELRHSEAQRLRESEACQMELAELEEAALKEGEEEDLFTEYTQLSHAGERCSKANEFNRLLTGDKQGLFLQLNRSKTLLEQLTSIDSSLTDTAKAYSNALIEIDEVAQTLRRYEQCIEHNPEKAEQLNARLQLIVKLKRKYGSTFAEMQEYLNNCRLKLKSLASADEQIEQLEQKVTHLAAANNKLAQEITAQRLKASKPFAAALIAQLSTLNMPKATIDVELAPQKRNVTGDDRIEFFITPNVGENRVSLRECASGGELSRMMLALQAVLAGKESIPTIIFDEIDANIGGETAKMVGEKLLEVGQQHQVLCITHFPQVAKQAQHHIRISKEEVEGRTVTRVDALDKKSHRQELVRMSGG